MEFILTIATCVTLTYGLETRGHATVYGTFVISSCMCPTVMIIFVLSGFQVKEFILTIATYLTITCDIETQCHAMVYVT